MISQETQTGVQERIDDALLLYKNGRYDGAMLLSLISLAALAEDEYDKNRLLDYFVKLGEHYNLDEVRKREKQAYEPKNPKKKRHPNERLRDGEKFKCIIFDNMPRFFTGDETGPSKGMPSNMALDTSFEDILYKFMRCKLVHTATMLHVGFCEPPIDKPNALLMFESRIAHRKKK